MKSRKSKDSSLPAGLKKNQRERTELVKAKLKRACAEIEVELQNGGGIYPHNRGRLTQAEVCRRADIKPMTLYGEKHKGKTKVALDEWLRKVLGLSVKGKKAIRSAVTGRVEQWKANLDAIAHAYHVVELEMVELRNTLRLLQDERDVLEKEVQSLRIQLSDGRVVPIGASKKVTRRKQGDT